MERKATIFDIQRSSYNDGPGIRTTLFFKGCPLKCLWCHNPESQKKSKQLFYFYDKCIACGQCMKVCGNAVHFLDQDGHQIKFENCHLCGACVENCLAGALKITGKEMTVQEIMEVVLADREYYEQSNGGVTLSGGEPLVYHEFINELLQSCKNAGINTCIETSGYATAEQFKQTLELVDILLFDHKITDAVSHKEFTGVSNETILKNLDYAYHSGTPIIVRCPVIPGINDTEEHFRGIHNLHLKYPDLMGIELLPYHSSGNNKRTSIGKETTLPDLKTTSTEISNRWLNKLKKMGCSKVKVSPG